MSRTEHESWREGDCLCGQGQVTKHVTSTDYVFMSVETSYTLDCPNCQRIWRFSGGIFIDRASENAANAAFQRLQNAHTELRLVAIRIIDRYFNQNYLSTKKAELEELGRLGLDAGNYRSYTASRRGGKSVGQSVNLSKGLGGLASIAGNDAAEMKRLLEFKQHLESEWKQLSGQILKRRSPR